MKGGGQYSGATIESFAGGGQAGGMALVGEKGPELVDYFGPGGQTIVNQPTLISRAAHIKPLGGPNMGFGSGQMQMAAGGGMTRLPTRQMSGYRGGGMTPLPVRPMKAYASGGMFTGAFTGAPALANSAYTASQPEDRMSGFWQDKNTGQFKAEPGSYMQTGMKGQSNYQVERTGVDALSLEKQRIEREKVAPALAGRQQVAKPGLPGATSVREEMEREIEDNRLRHGYRKQEVDKMTMAEWGTDQDQVLSRRRNPEANIRDFGFPGTQHERGGWVVRESDVTKRKWAAAHRSDEKYGNYSDNLDKKRVLERYAKQYPSNEGIQRALQEHIMYMDMPKVDNIRSAISGWDKLDDNSKKYFNPFSSVAIGHTASSFLKRQPELAEDMYKFAQKTGQTRYSAALEGMGFGIQNIIPAADAVVSMARQEVATNMSVQNQRMRKKVRKKVQVNTPTVINQNTVNYDTHLTLGDDGGVPDIPGSYGAGAM